MLGLLGYIPSPSSNGISIGPLRLHMYGFLIVAGVFAAVWLADRRWQARGGEAGTFSAIALWAVPGGLIGARLYHVVTDYELYTHHPLRAFEIWQGGLGIWGGISGGVLVGWIYIRRHGLDFPAILDTVAPALPLAQAIGRWGNYFNQELFGRPTTLPWGLKIDQGIVGNLFAAVNKPVPPAYLNAHAFHPTFLYESLWDLAVVLLVLWVEKHVRLRKGYLFGVYVALYTFGRFFTEYMRIDFAHKILGLRINDWVSVIIFVVATTIVLTRGRRGKDEPPAGDAGRADLEPASVAAGSRAIVGGDTLTEGSIGLSTDDEPRSGPPPEVEVFRGQPAGTGLAEPAPRQPDPEPQPAAGPAEPAPAQPAPETALVPAAPVPAAPADSAPADSAPVPPGAGTSGGEPPQPVARDDTEAARAASDPPPD